MKKRKYQFELDSRNGTWVPLGSIKDSPDLSSVEPTLEDLLSSVDELLYPNRGKIYLLVHDSGRSVKIGRTTKSSTQRKNNYVRTHKLAGKWELVDEWQVDDAVEVEKCILRELKRYQISNKSKEVFVCSELEARKIIYSYV